MTLKTPFGGAVIKWSSKDQLLLKAAKGTHGSLTSIWGEGILKMIWNRPFWEMGFARIIISLGKFSIYLFCFDATQWFSWSSNLQLEVFLKTFTIIYDNDEITFSAKVKIFLWSTPPNCASTPRCSSSIAC